MFDEMAMGCYMLCDVVSDISEGMMWRMEGMLYFNLLITMYTFILYVILKSFVKFERRRKVSEDEAVKHTPCTVQYIPVTGSASKTIQLCRLWVDNSIIIPYIKFNNLFA